MDDWNLTWTMRLGLQDTFKAFIPGHNKMVSLDIILTFSIMSFLNMNVRMRLYVKEEVIISWTRIFQLLKVSPRTLRGTWLVCCRWMSWAREVSRLIMSSLVKGNGACKASDLLPCRSYMKVVMVKGTQMTDRYIILSMRMVRMVTRWKHISPAKRKGFITLLYKTEVDNS